jgi:hypothetical protein
MFATWPAPAVTRNYPELVSYYGKLVARDEVIADKGRFAARWPQRRYVLSSSVVHCSDGAAPICDADAYGDWEVRSATNTASGTIHMTYSITWLNADPKITDERGETVRNPAVTTPSQSDDWKKQIFENR